MLDETKTQATIGELARIVKKDRRTVAVILEKSGVEPCGHAGTGNRQARVYDLDQALEALKTDPDTSELTKLKAQKLRLEIERIEEANAIASGELVRCDLVKDFWTTALHTLHRSSTTRLPREIAGQAMQFAKSNNATAAQI